MATHIPFAMGFFFTVISQFLSIFAQSNNYIVHMDLSAMPSVFSTHHSWYLATLDGASDNTRLSNATTINNPTSSSFSKHIYTYTHALHGFSASLSPSALEAIKNSPGYVSHVRDSPAVLDTTHSAQFLGLNSNYGAWPSSNYGSDIIIGVVDSGVWPESKSYNDDGMPEIPSRWKGKCESGTQFNSSMCNKKLIGARYFNKGLLAEEPSRTIAMNSPRDTDGHGTHTSSTAAGNYVEGASYFGYAKGVARGMAPRARLAVYKVFFDAGVSRSDVLAAIDQAIIDGVDVLSLSFSFGEFGFSPLYEDPVAIASFAAMEKGIFVSTSAGNRGPDIRRLSNGTPWLLTVAAGTVDRDFGGTITLGNGVSIKGSSLYPGNSTSKQVPIIFKGLCDSVEELKKVRNKIVVCNNDTDVGLYTQLSNVGQAEVAVGIFITTETELREFIRSDFPAVFLSPQTGEVILDYIKTSSKPKAIVKFRQTYLGSKPAPQVDSYSSRGPSRSSPFTLKPDLMAPGSFILAAWPSNVPAVTLPSGELFSNYNLQFGTSMACPHAAGVAALLKGVHPEWSPAAIRSAMMTTADALDNTFNPILRLGYNSPASPLEIGSGHINPNKALAPGLIYDIKIDEYLNLLCGLNFTSKQIQTITKKSSYKCSNPSLDINYPSFIAYFNANADDNNTDTRIVQEFRRTVTNIGDGMSIYSAKLTKIKGVKVRVVPEKLIFKAKYEKLSYKLSIEGPRRLTETAVYGSLSWVEVKGKHVVRSPILATRLSSEMSIGIED